MANESPLQHEQNGICFESTLYKIVGVKSSLNEIGIKALEIKKSVLESFFVNVQIQNQ